MGTIEKGELTEQEKQLFQGISDVNLDRFEVLLKEKDVRIDCLDEHGTTPLQQASFKGSLEMCQKLLKKGADVNSNEHEHGYTALMFAGLSGNADLCRLLLEAGAKTYRTNRVGRTASEMAAFTGQHHCVSVINNFLSQEDIERIIKPKGSETEPKLPLRFASLLHKLSRTYNVHPVKTLLLISENDDILKYQKPVLTVMEQLFERQMKQKETNEVMALKLYIIFNTLREAFKFMEKQRQGNSTKSDSDLLLLYAKHLLNTPDKKNFDENLEKLIRESIQKFPYHHCILFQTVVKTLSKIEFGSEPTATSIIHQALLGHRMMADEIFCATCGESRAQKRCAACKSLNYCSSQCQKLHWFIHKKWCKKMAKEREEKEEKLKEFYNPPETDENDSGHDQTGEIEGKYNELNGETKPQLCENEDVNVDQIQLEMK